MKNIQTFVQSEELDQQHNNYYICTTPNCQNRGLILQSSIESNHKNCEVVQYQKFIDQIKNYDNQCFPQETFQNQNQQLNQYIKKIDILQSFLNGQQLKFKNIKKYLKICMSKEKQKKILQDFENTYIQSNFELLDQIYQLSKNQQQQTIQHYLDGNNDKIKTTLQEIEQYLKPFDREEINLNQLSETDESSDDDDHDDDHHQNKNIQNIQQEPELQELENKYNQAFNFLRNNALIQIQQINEEQQPQLEQQQYEEQTNIKYIEKFGYNLIVVATDNQIRIYDLKSKTFQPQFIQINSKISSIQVTKLESVIVVGKKNGHMEVLEKEDSKMEKTFNSRIFRVSDEEGRLFIEKLQSSQSHSDIACLGRDLHLKIYETSNFNIKNNIKLDYGVQIIPTCIFVKSDNFYLIGAEKYLFFNDKKITHVFKEKIKYICQYGDLWLIADKQRIYILKQYQEGLLKLKKIEQEFSFSKKQIKYLTTFNHNQYIFINTKSNKSNKYENLIVTIDVSEKQMFNENLNKNIQVKLLKGYQNTNQTFLYAIDEFNIIEYKLIRENDKFLVQ